MNKLLIASLGAMLTATPAFAADSDSESFDITGNVAETCTMEGINDVELGTLSIDTTAGSGALFINNTSAEETDPFWVSCNESNRMLIEADLGVLKNQTRTLQAGDDAGFKDTINYSVRALNYFNSGAGPEFNSANGSTGQNTVRGAIHRQVELRARVRANENTDLRPLAGEYRDTVTVTVTTI
ncbi:MAG TPA: spore coat protein U domain-containing protein [Sphingopyxis sp.]|nr:spore coat protein U domain-containing protein [Sphingopyxis sp.]